MADLFGRRFLMTELLLKNGCQLFAGKVKEEGRDIFSSRGLGEIEKEEGVQVSEKL